MANYGIKVSKDGFDVKTATDVQLVMTSKSNLLKTKLTGTVTGTGTVAHGLAYVPIFFFIQKITGNNTRYTVCGSVPTSAFEASGIYVDDTNLEYYADGRYYIFYQEL